MDEKKKDQPADVPYYIYEGAVVRAERYFRRAIIALVIVAVAGILYAYASNKAWMSYIERNYVPIEQTEGNASDDG